MIIVDKIIMNSKNIKQGDFVMVTINKIIKKRKK